MKICKIVLFILFFVHYAFADNELRERVYVHTDKSFYLSGELLWMKFYLTDETGKPSSFSKVGYVELLHDSVPDVRVKLDLVNGVGEGRMVLPSALPTGNYRLVAYTRMMRNEGEAVFFRKIIGLVNMSAPDTPIETDTSLQIVYKTVPETNVSVSTNEKTYKPLIGGEIKIEGLPDNIHSLSLSVAGMDFVPDNHTIGYWHKNLPAYPEAPLQTDFLPEYEGHIIQGNILDAQTNEPSVEAGLFPVVSFVDDRIRLFGGTVKGTEVYFFTKQIQGMRELAATVYTTSGHPYKVNIRSPFASHEKETLPPLKLNPGWEEQLVQRSVGLQVLYAYTSDSLNKTDTTYAHLRWQPDRSYKLDEYTRFLTMDEVITEFIPLLRFRRINDKRYLFVLDDKNTFSSGNSLVLVDGVPVVDHEIVFRYDPLLVRRIDVYRDQFVFGNKYFDGMVFFSTYTGDYAGLKPDAFTLFYDYEGTLPHDHFYAPPRAGKSKQNSRTPDYRHTLLWIPELDVQRQTRISVPFGTSDITGEFQVKIEGLTKDGKAICGITYFTVNEY